MMQKTMTYSDFKLNSFTSTKRFSLHKSVASSEDSWLGLGLLPAHEASWYDVQDEEVELKKKGTSLVDGGSLFKIKLTIDPDILRYTR